MTLHLSPASNRRRAPRTTQTWALPLIASLILLTGCSPTSDTPREEPSIPESSASGEDTADAAEANWPAVDESGVGPTTLTLTRPSKDAFYLNASFTCTTGQSTVELQEDPRVFMSGPCGGSSNYQMPLPDGATELNFTIDVEEGTKFDFSGTYSPRL